MEQSRQPFELSPIKILQEAIQLPFKHFRSLMILLWPPLFFIVVLSLFMKFSSLELFSLDDPTFAIKILLIWILSLMWIVKAVVSCHRLFILNEPIVDWLVPVKFAKRELKFTAIVILVGVFCFLVAIPIMLIVMPILLSIFDVKENLVLMTVFSNIIMLPIFYFSSRWVLLFPAFATDNAKNISWAWRLSEGNGAQLFLLIGILPFMTKFLLGLVPETESILIQIVNTLVWLIVLVIEIGILSICYQQLLNNVDESQLLDKEVQSPNKAIISDEQLQAAGIDYSSYSKAELEECLNNIDREMYPDRVNIIKLALSRF